MYNLLHLLIRVVNSVEDGRLFIRSISSISVHVDQWCFPRAVRSISVDVGQWRRAVVDTIAFEYSSAGFADLQYIHRAIRSILIDVGHGLWVLNPA